MIWISDEWKDYEVLDASDGERLERWGKHILVRPDPQVIWNTPKIDRNWKNYDARYLRSNTGGGRWTDHDLPERWQIKYKDYLTFNVKPMNFKHTGVFPEHPGEGRFPGIPEACPGAEPVRLLRRCHPGCRRGRRRGLACGRQQGHGRLGQGKCPGQRPF